MDLVVTRLVVQASRTLLYDLSLVAIYFGSLRLAGGVPIEDVVGNITTCNMSS